MQLQDNEDLEMSVLLGYSTYVNGQIAQEKLQFTTAILNYRLALGIYETYFNSDYLATSMMLFNLGAVYLEVRNFENARDCYEKCHKIRT
jgi:tetratricopeptide (TPR) repeat protein